MKFRNTKENMRSLLNSPNINCESCEAFHLTCKDKMILEGYIWGTKEMATLILKG